MLDSDVFDIYVLDRDVLDMDGPDMDVLDLQALNIDMFDIDLLDIKHPSDCPKLTDAAAPAPTGNCEVKP